MSKIQLISDTRADQHIVAPSRGQKPFFHSSHLGSEESLSPKMATLPRFGSSGVNAHGSVVKRSLGVLVESTSVSSLREMALESLEALRKMESGALDVALEKHRDLLLEEKRVERSTLGRTDREELELAVRSLIRALSPVATTREALVVLEYLAQAYEALDFASDDLLAACLPFPSILWSIASATRGAASTRWEFLTEFAKRTARAPISRGLLARQCVREPAFIDVVFNVGKDAASAVGDDAATLPLYGRHFSFFAATLCDAVALCPESSSEAVTRILLPNLSDALREPRTAGDRAWRVATYAVVAAFSAAKVGSPVVVAAAVDELVRGALADKSDDGADDGLCRAISAAVISQSRVGDGALKKDTLEALVKSKHFQSAVCRSDPSILSLLCPQLAAYAVGEKMSPATRIAEDVVVKLGFADAANSRLVLRSSAAAAGARADASSVLARFATAAVRSLPSGAVDGALALPIFKPVLEAPEACAELVAARVRLAATLVSLPSDLCNRVSDPTVASALEARLSSKTDPAERIVVLEALAVDSRDWARYNLDAALDVARVGGDKDDARLLQAVALFARHVASVDDLVPFARLKAKKNKIDLSSALDVLGDKTEYRPFKLAALSILRGDNVAVEDEVAIALARRLTTEDVTEEGFETEALARYFDQKSCLEAAAVAAPKLSRIGGVAAQRALKILSRAAADGKEVTARRALEAAAISALGRFDDDDFESRVSACLASFVPRKSTESAVAWILSHRGAKMEYRLARLGALRLATARASHATDLLPFVLAAAGDKDQRCRVAALEWLVGFGDSSPHATFAAVRRASIAADPDQFAAAIRGHLDTNWLDLLLVPLSERLEDPMHLALILALLENIFDKGGKQSALTVAWRGDDDNVDGAQPPFPNAAKFLHTALQALLKGGGVGGDKRSMGDAPPARRRGKAIGGKGRSFLSSREKDEDDTSPSLPRTSNSPNVIAARRALLDVLLRSRFTAAASSAGGLALGDDLAEIVLTALEYDDHQSLSNDDCSDDFSFLGSWCKSTTPMPRIRALEALSACTPGAKTVSEEMESRLFAKCLELLRANDAAHKDRTSSAPLRSLALKALRGLSVPDKILARAWAAALKRPGTPSDGDFVTDVFTLLEAMGARRESDAPSAAVSGALFATLRRLNNMPSPRPVETSVASRQLLAELETLARAWKSNRTKDPMPAVDLELAVDVAAQDGSGEAACAVAAVVRVAPTDSVAQHWPKIVQIAVLVAYHGEACKAIFTALTPALLLSKRDTVKPRLMSRLVRVVCGSMLLKSKSPPSKETTSTVLRALSQSLDIILAPAHGVAVVILFVLACRAHLEQQAADAPGVATDIAKFCAESMLSTQRTGTQLIALTALVKAAHRLTTEDEDTSIVLSEKELALSSVKSNTCDLTVCVRDLLEEDQASFVETTLVAAACCSLVGARLTALVKSHHALSSRSTTECERLALCHELAHSVSIGDEEAQLKIAEDDDGDVDDDVLDASEAGVKVRLIRAFARSLRRATRLLGDTSFVTFVQHLLSTEHSIVRDAALTALHERLSTSKLFVTASNDEENGFVAENSDKRGSRRRRRRRREEDERLKGRRASLHEGCAPTTLARLVLEDLLPHVASALVASGDEYDAAVSLSAARAADVMARALADRAPHPFAPLVEAAATAAAVAARASLPTSVARVRAMFSLLSTLFATLRIKSLPVLAKALPRAIDAVRSATSSEVAKLTGLRALHVIVASIPKFVHPHLSSILDLLVTLKAASVPLGDERPIVVVTADATEDRGDEAALMALRIARALASGVEPRLLLPALYAAHERAKNGIIAKRAAVLSLTLPAVDALGRGAARSHASALAFFSLDASLAPSQPSVVEAPAVKLTLSLLLKLNEADFVDWLRAASDWGLGDDDPKRRAAFYLILATVLDRLTSIAAPHVATILLDVAPEDLIAPKMMAKAKIGGHAPPCKKRRKKRSETEDEVPTGADDAFELRCMRLVAALRLVFEHCGDDDVDVERFDNLAPLLVDLIPHTDSVEDQLAPCIAALANTTRDEAKHRALNRSLMLLARDGPLPARLNALAVIKCLVEKLGPEVANFANQMVQAISECLEDPKTTEPAREIILLVSDATGISIV